MKVTIIGSGFSSLAAACYLAKAGNDVSVFEKNEQAGGRASVLQEDGFQFDMGPSWYWMPDVFEKFFEHFGKQSSDYYELQKLSPAYRVIFGKNDFIDIADDPAEIKEVFENLEPGSGKFLSKFLISAKENYRIAMQNLVYKPGISLLELITPETVSRLNLFAETISSRIRKNIKNPRLRSILEFPVLFLGAKPGDTPAFYNFMNWADFGLGTWYPKGGFHSVVNALVSLAEELGVKFHFGEEIIKINAANGKATEIVTESGTYHADIFISGADYAHTEKLLDDNANYTGNYWQKKTFAPSALLYYVGFNQKVKHLLHHNLFFDTDFEAHAKEIYDTKTFPKQPLFYANFSSKTDNNLCNADYETGFFLIPVAVDLEDSAEIQEKYFEIILKRIHETTGEDLRDAIVYRKNFGISDFKDRYHSCRGNAYGLANTLMQTSILRPSIRNKKLSNFFYTGQLTVPGPGVPPALISGKIVSEYILKKNQK